METNMTQSTSNNGNRIGRIVYPWLITVVGAVMMLVVLLLPFATATKEYRERLLKYPDQMYVQELEMTCKDVVNLSLVDYARVYGVAAEQGVQKNSATASIVIIVVYGGISLLLLVLAVCKKPIGVMVFDVLAMIAFWIIRFDFKDRGVVPGSSYNPGIGSWLAYVLGVFVFVGAVWLLIEKVKVKKMWQGQ